jgi:glucose-6-phosphate 1-dehydrogenase
MPTILIIIGVTGDLSRRYLLPSIEKIAAAHALPDSFRIVGVTRQAMSTDEVLSDVSGPTGFVRDHLDICQVDLTKLEAYDDLENHLKSIEADYAQPAQRLYYLSIPPQASQPVVRLLGESGLSNRKHTKLLLEKPFGVDLASAEDLLAYTEQYFKESQIYRIDHYLAKEMAQNILVFREANPLLRHTWSGDFIERIDIVSSEAIDIEGRAGFYEQTGALRDVMQSHVLQLAALTLMNPDDTAHTVPQKRLAALKQLHVPTDKPVGSLVVRGQYEGYMVEVNNPGSTVETYVSVTLASHDPRWGNVPIQLTTGKALKTRQTTITLTYRSDPGSEPNQLVLQIQPDAGIQLRLWTKTPGYEHKVEQQALHFAYQDHFTDLPDAYEQVLVDAINGNHTLFTSSDEVRESWRILEPIQHEWSMRDDDLIIYPKGADVTTIAHEVRP